MLNMNQDNRIGMNFLNSDKKYMNYSN